MARNRCRCRDRAESGNRDKLPLTVNLALVVNLQGAAFIRRRDTHNTPTAERLGRPHTSSIPVLGSALAARLPSSLLRLSRQATTRTATRLTTATGSLEPASIRGDRLTKICLSTTRRAESLLLSETRVPLYAATTCVSPAAAIVAGLISCRRVTGPTKDLWRPSLKQRWIGAWLQQCGTVNRTVRIDRE